MVKKKSGNTAKMALCYNYSGVVVKNLNLQDFIAQRAIGNRF